jgi:hypothetical protein
MMHSLVNNTGKPVVSPKGIYVLAANADLEVGYMMNGFELFKHHHGKLRLIEEIELTDWEPREIVWESDTVLTILRVKVDDDHEPNFSFVEMRIR